MSVDLDRTVVLRGEAELVERAGRLFTACEEFACAATDMHTWAMPGAREAIVAATIDQVAAAIPATKTGPAGSLPPR